MAKFNEHSELPWSIENSEDGQIFIQSDDGQFDVIAEIGNQDIAGEAENNAKFITHVCNNYYTYEHIIKELLAVIAEYRAMPCESLRQRMFDSEVRYRLRFKNTQTQ